MSGRGAPRSTWVRAGPSVGLPGTGISYQATLSKPASRARRAQETQAVSYNEQVPYVPASQPPPRSFPVKTVGVVAGAAIMVLWLSSGGRGPSSPAAVPVSAADASEAAVPWSGRVEATTGGQSAAAAQQTADTVVILATENIRDGAGRHARIVGVAHQSERYAVFGRFGSWVEIVRAAPIGWVGASRLGK